MIQPIQIKDKAASDQKEKAIRVLESMNIRQTLPSNGESTKSDKK